MADDEVLEGRVLGIDIDLSTGEITGDHPFPATPGPAPPPPSTRRTHSAAPMDFARRSANRLRPEVLKSAD
jgi:hypothetical protein